MGDQTATSDSGHAAARSLDGMAGIFRHFVEPLGRDIGTVRPDNYSSLQGNCLKYDVAADVAIGWDGSAEAIVDENQPHEDSAGATVGGEAQSRRARREAG